jgi:hypothetical protein
VVQAADSERKTLDSYWQQREAHDKAKAEKHSVKVLVSLL